MRQGSILWQAEKDGHTFRAVRRGFGMRVQVKVEDRWILIEDRTVLFERNAEQMIDSWLHDQKTG